MSKLTWAKNDKTNFIDRKIEGPLRVRVKPKGDRIKKYGFFTQSSTFGKQEFVKPLINCPADLWLNLYNKLKQENDIMIEVYNVSEDRFCIEMQLVGKYDFYNNTDTAVIVSAELKCGDKELVVFADSYDGGMSGPERFVMGVFHDTGDAMEALFKDGEMC